MIQHHKNRQMTKINPKYEYMRQWIENIPDIFEKEGTAIYEDRNKIKVFVAPDGRKVNVKRYHVPGGLNKFIYSWNIIKPKGQRAFEYPSIMLEKDIYTPEPIALIEERSHLDILGYSYFISVQCDYEHTLYEMGDATPDEYEGIAIALGQFAAFMHEKHILHKDFTPGNILWKKDGEGYHFAIVDINRMYFGEINMMKGVTNLTRLWGPKKFIQLLITEYAIARHFNVDAALAIAIPARARFWKRYQRKHEIEFKLEL